MGLMANFGAPPADGFAASVDFDSASMFVARTGAGLHAEIGRRRQQHRSAALFLVLSRKSVLPGLIYTATFKFFRLFSQAN
jgi:cation transporter-like permease